jgi:hypothetical protein
LPSGNRSSTSKKESYEKPLHALLITHLPAAGRDFKDDYRDFWTFSEISKGTSDKK